jgi:multisubunit Na+/H+ antiporter MnhB subunit
MTMAHRSDSGEHRRQDQRPSRLVRIGAAGATGLLGILLVQVVVDLPRTPGGLTALVVENLPASGVRQPVTAVLLNFRAYDTWLEVGVLFLAVLNLLCLRRSSDLANVAPPLAEDQLLAGMARQLLPMAVLTGGYLLWLGTHSPGGAFQAGAVLAAGGIVLRIAGHRSVAALRMPVLQVALLSGFAAFLLMAMALLVAGRALLEYPEGLVGTLIVLIEAGIAISVAFTLVALFTGAEPNTEPASLGARRGPTPSSPAIRDSRTRATRRPEALPQPPTSNP